MSNIKNRVKGFQIGMRGIIIGLAIIAVGVAYFVDSRVYSFFNSTVFPLFGGFSAWIMDRMVDLGVLIAPTPALMYRLVVVGFVIGGIVCFFVFRFFIDIRKGLVRGAIRDSGLTPATYAPPHSGPSAPPATTAVTEKKSEG